MFTGAQIFSLICLALIQQSSGQTDRFIVDVVSFTPPNHSPRILRCSGTVITPQHILTTASCASVSDSTQSLAIHVPTSSDSSVEGVTIPARRIFIHPDYDQDQHRNANVAVIQMERELNSTVFQPRTLGSLPTNSTCNLFGWGGAAENPRRNSIFVFNSQFCDPNFPTAFCSTFDTRTHDSCSAVEGSPVVCFDSTIDGFLIDNVQACANNNDRFFLNFHSVSEYREWIDEVSASRVSVISSIFLILSCVFISKGIM